MTIWSRIARTAVAALVLAGVARAAGAADPYEIHVLLPMSGSASFYSVSQQQSLKVIENNVNRQGGVGGRPIKFVLHDDQSDAKNDVQFASQIISGKASVILGPTLTAQCNAVMPMVVKEGPATWCFTPGARPPAGGFVFGFGADTSHTTNVSLRYLASRGIKRVALITSTDASGQDGERSIDAAAAAQNVTIVEREHFNPTDVSTNAQIAKMKAAEPQAIIVWTTGTPFGTVLRGLQELGVEVPILTTNGNITNGQMKQYASFLPKELLFPGAAFLDPAHVDDPQVRSVVKTFIDGIAAQGGRPDWGNNNCYDGARLFVDALRKYGPQATALQVRDYVASQRNWAGINGKYDFVKQPQRGLGDDSVVMVRWSPTSESWVAVSKPGGAPL